VKVSVVIPTRDRPGDLKRCLAALTEQTSRARFEVVVVNDGLRPIPEEVLAACRPRPLVIQGPGTGPAAARNAGWRGAAGEIVVFTDDDTLPSATWVEAASTLLEAAPGVVGIEGPTISRAFDPLFEHSVAASGPGAWLTCNIAYRRSALEAVEGFYEGFPSAHCEDLDLGFRIEQVGGMAFDRGMEVEHTVRPITLSQHVRNGRLVASETMLFRRHPARYADELAARPVVRAAKSRLRRWLSFLKHERGRLIFDPDRLARWLVIVVGQTVVAAITAQRFASDPRHELGVRAD
jgi:glycosyltransferase involved in cell wall biosynthesis